MSKRAEEAALKAYPEQLNVVAGPYPCEPFTTDTNAVLRKAHKEGYEQAEKDIVSIIQTRLNEIQGDAQPRPVLRMELQELINKIENGDN